MTKEEASKRYQIPISILNEYESWSLRCHEKSYGRMAV